MLQHGSRIDRTADLLSPVSADGTLAAQQDAIDQEMEGMKNQKSMELRSTTRKLVSDGTELDMASHTRFPSPPTPSSMSQSTESGGIIQDQFQKSKEPPKPGHKHAKSKSQSSQAREADSPEVDLTFSSSNRASAKRQRDNAASADGDHEGTEEILGKGNAKQRSREKNKIAAAKCRAKKRENVETIESSHRTLSAENSYLRRQEQYLRATVAQLRTLALDHQSCNCGVQEYNMFEARKLARGLGNLPMAAQVAGESAEEVGGLSSQRRGFSWSTTSDEDHTGDHGSISALYNVCPHPASTLDQFDMSLLMDSDSFLQMPADAFDEPDFFNLEPSSA